MPEIISSSLREPAGTGNIKLLSTEVREIISRKPNWIVRNGILLLFAIIAVIFSATFFISYPDVVTANARLTSVNAPKEVRAKTEGMLVKLLVKEGQQVQQGQVIGFMESSADHRTVIGLSQTIDSIENLLDHDIEKLPDFAALSYKHLGEVQPYYQAFIGSFTTFRQYVSSGFYVQKRRMIQDDMSFLQRLHTNLEEQRKIQQEDLHLAGQTFNANKSLSDDKVIAASEYRTEQSRYLSKAMSIPQINALLINNESSHHEKEKELVQLDNDIALQKKIFSQALNTFKAQLDDWKSKYLLITAAAGKIAFPAIIEEKTHIKQGQMVCFINPENTQYYATLLIPQANFGKIRTGERVLLKLSAYPYREFGVLKGTLNFISSMPTDSGFMAKIILPEGLTTNYKKQLAYREGLIAQAEIITKDLKLSDRIFNELRSVTASK
jgi:multidrug efflux pump subunit AcrA (membrane-fusion protein)